MSAIEFLRKANEFVAREMANRAARARADPTSSGRHYLLAAHETNLKRDCTTRDDSLQDADGVALTLKKKHALSGAIAVAEKHDASGDVVMSIQKDRTMGVYLNFETLRGLSKVVTLVELSQRKNIAVPLVIKDISVLAYSPSTITLKGPVDVNLNSRYGVLVQYQAATMPKAREFLNTVSLMYRSDECMTPLVRSFVNYFPGVPYQSPVIDEGLSNVSSWAFSYTQAPPGAGKTWQLIRDLMKVVLMGKNCFVIAPTNKVVLEISTRLSSKKCPHNVALSDAGMHAQLDHAYANNVSKGLEQVFKGPERFDKRAREHSTIFLMTINKFLTPKYESRGFQCAYLFWDEFALTSTCTFFSVLNKNPLAIFSYGDQKQGVPYESERDSDFMLKNPIRTFDLTRSNCYRFLGERTRMPPLYSDFFLRYFYLGTCDVLVNASFGEMVGLYCSIETHHSLIKCQRSIYDKFPSSWMRYNDYALSPLGGIYVTPYLAQEHHVKINDMVPGYTVYTFRPVQGQQHEHVYLDFTRDKFSGFFTNTNVLTAMSRFKQRMTISHVPALPKDLCPYVHGYVYDTSKTVSLNFKVFVICLESKGYTCELDDNGDHPLFWWFYLCVLEYALFCAGRLPYLVTMFAYVANVCGPGPDILCANDPVAAVLPETTRAHKVVINPYPPWAPPSYKPYFKAVVGAPVNYNADSVVYKYLFDNPASTTFAVATGVRRRCPDLTDADVEGVLNHLQAASVCKRDGLDHLSLWTLVRRF